MVVGFRVVVVEVDDFVDYWLCALGVARRVWAGRVGAVWCTLLVVCAFDLEEGRLRRLGMHHWSSVPHLAFFL